MEAGGELVRDPAPGLPTQPKTFGHTESGKGREACLPEFLPKVESKESKVSGRLPEELRANHRADVNAGSSARRAHFQPLPPCHQAKGGPRQ